MSKKKVTTREQIDSLLNHLQPALRTKRKEAIEDFSAFFFERRSDRPTEKEVFKLYVGEEKRLGLLAICGIKSKRTGKLAKAAVSGMKLLAKLLNPLANEIDSMLFRQVFLSLESGSFALLELDEHITEGNIEAANYIGKLIQDPNQALQEPRGSFALDVAVDESFRLSVSKVCISGQAKKWSVVDCMTPRTQQSIRQAALYPPGSPSTFAMPAEEQQKLLIKKGIIAKLSEWLLRRADKSELVQKGYIKPGNTFGVPLSEVARTDDVPDIVRLLVDFIRPDICKLEGVFRLSGDSLEIQDLKHTFDFESTEGLDLAKFGAHTITGLLKLYIRELPDPLLTYDRYDSLVEFFRNDDKAGCDMVIASLPAANLATWNFLLDFLARVQAFHTTNMMTAKNLAIVFAPNIMRLKVETFERVAKDTPVTIGALEYFIEQRAKLITPPDDFPEDARESMHKRSASVAMPLTTPILAKAPCAMPPPLPTNPFSFTSRRTKSCIPSFVPSPHASSPWTPTLPSDMAPSFAVCLWKKFRDANTGVDYYYNTITEETSWVAPPSFLE